MSYNFTDFIAAGTARSSYRFSTMATGHYRTRLLWRKFHVLDISREGIRLGGAPHLRVGQKLQIALPVIGKLSATVRWTESDATGCEFAAPLDPVLLDAYVLKALTERTVPTGPERTEEP